MNKGIHNVLEEIVKEGVKKMYFILLTAPNWEIVSAVTNIVLSILTFLALMITLYTVRINSFPKAKVYFTIEGKGISYLYRIKLVNERNVPITVNYKGFYFINKKGNKIAINQSENKIKLEWTDSDYYSVYDGKINEMLLKQGFSCDEIVKIYGFFKTSTNKLYTKKLSHKITQSVEEQINSTLTLNAD